MLLALVAVAAFGCGDRSSSVSRDLAAAPDMVPGAHASGVVSTPTEHRASATACAAAPTLPACQYGTCTTAADCTAGQNGRCVSGRVDCSCIYDQCNSDSDCPAGQDCACHLAYRGTMGAGPNSCVPANCQSDADCASGFCSPSYTTGACESYVDGYYCHTAQDECGVNADCVADGIGYPVCAYRPELGHWACVLGDFCAG